MRTLGLTMTMGVLALAGACSRGADARPDDGLKNDLALAAQVQPYQAQQFTSRIQLLEVGRPVLAEFNGVKIAGRTWPVANNEVTVMELTY